MPTKATREGGGKRGDDFAGYSSRVAVNSSAGSLVNFPGLF